MQIDGTGFPCSATCTQFALWEDTGNACHFRKEDYPTSFFAGYLQLKVRRGFDILEGRMSGFPLKLLISSSFPAWDVSATFIWNSPSDHEDWLDFDIQSMYSGANIMHVTHPWFSLKHVSETEVRLVILTSGLTKTVAQQYKLATNMHVNKANSHVSTIPIKGQHI